MDNNSFVYQAAGFGRNKTHLPLYRIDEAVTDALLNGMENLNDNFPIDIILSDENATIRISPEEWLKKHLYFYPYEAASTKDRQIELHAYVDQVYPDQDERTVIIDYAIETVIPTGMQAVSVYGRKESRASMILGWIIDTIDLTKTHCGVLEFDGYRHFFQEPKSNVTAKAYKPNYYGHKIIFRIRERL